MERFTEEKIKYLVEANKRLGIDKSNRDIVFVYSPPKVGSTTIVTSLRLSANHMFHVFHFHDEQALQILTGIVGVSIEEVVQYNSCLGREVYVIDIYREPLERKMSEYFGKLSSFHFNNTPENVKKYRMQTLIDRFNSLFPHIGEGDHFLEKFSVIQHMKPHRFDFDKKYIWLKHENVHYVKLRLRDSAIWGKLLKEILGEDVVMVRDYERKDLPLGDLYLQFKQQYKIPENFIEDIQASGTFGYYLDDNEQVSYLAALRERSTLRYPEFSHADFCTYMRISEENQFIRDVEYEHYLDDGCNCHMCDYMRVQMLGLVKKGGKVRRKLTHSNVVKHFQENPQEMQKMRVLAEQAKMHAKKRGGLVFPANAKK